MKKLSKIAAEAGLRWRDQAGFNLIGAIVIVSLLAMVTYLVAQSQKQSVAAKQNVRAASAYEEILQPFQSAVVEKLKAHFNAGSFPGCPTRNAFASGAIGSNFRFNYSASFPPQQEPASLTTVKNSCNSPRFQDGNFKFCLAIQPMGGSRRTDNNMSSMDNIIAELDISLMNIQDNKALTCSEFYAGKSAYSVRINYTLNWLYAPKGQAKALHKKRRGTFYAIL